MTFSLLMMGFFQWGLNPIHGSSSTRDRQLVAAAEMRKALLIAILNAAVASVASTLLASGWGHPDR